MSDRTPQLQDKYMLRLPDGMRDFLKQEAEQNGRSLNAEIVQRLQDSIGLDSDLAKQVLKDRLTPQNELAAIRRELSLIRAALGPVVETRRLPDGSEEITFRRERLEAIPDDAESKGDETSTE